MDIGDLERDPLVQVAAWMDEARRAGSPVPEAMCLATASQEGEPSARMVLLRGLDSGFVFFTDYGSDKARQLAANPHAAVVLHLLAPVHRQIRAAGPVARVSPAESDRYWQSRPAASRRSAVASRQSSVIEDRAELEQAVAALAGTVPQRPERWGGFRLTPSSVELWEEGTARLHDRIRFVGGGEHWRTERLSP